MEKFAVLWIQKNDEKIISKHDTLDAAKTAGKSFNSSLKKDDGLVSVVLADFDDDGNFSDSKRKIYHVF